jgi:hypothetical protein
MVWSALSHHEEKNSNRIMVMISKKLLEFRHTILFMKNWQAYRRQFDDAIIR